MQTLASACSFTPEQVSVSNEEVAQIGCPQFALMNKLRRRG
jgi:hypothetical protein